MLPIAWVITGVGIPSGGVALAATYRDGRGEGGYHLALLNPVLGPIFDGDLFAGSLNFWADCGLAFPEPAVAYLAEEPWSLIPVVINEQAVGVAARKGGSGDLPFIEVYAREKLAPRLGLQPGCRVKLRLLSGRHLAPAV